MFPNKKRPYGAAAAATAAAAGKGGCLSYFPALVRLLNKFVLAMKKNGEGVVGWLLQ